MAPGLPIWSYLHRQMTELRYTAVNTGFPTKFIVFCLALFFICLIPYVHIGVVYMKFWVPDKPLVDHQSCTCSCFDTVFRGSFENPGKVGAYKHVYFNATSTTLKIWIFTAAFLLLFYESLRYLVGLLRSGTLLRCSMLFLYVVNFYPHYYSWWSFFIYYNEELFTYFTHHLMFTITELIVTAIVLNLCNRDNEFSSSKLCSIVTISLVHIIVSGTDQFIAQIIHGEGYLFQNVRDLGLMGPDVLHVLIPLREFYLHAHQKKQRIRDLCQKEEVVLMCVFVSLGTVLGRLI